MCLLRQQAHADAPVEQFAATAENISAAVLRETRATLSIRFADADYFREYLSQEVPVASVMLHDKTPAGFAAQRPLLLAEAKPVSGWLFDGQRVIRLPVLREESGFLLIVHDIVSDRRAWLGRSELERLASSSPLNRFAIDQFDQDAQLETPLALDIFTLAGRQQVSIYPDATLQARPVIATPESKILWLQGEVFDDRALVITQISNGLGKLHVNEDVQAPARFVGWIRLRNDSGELAVWPVIGLAP